MRQQVGDTLVALAVTLGAVTAATPAHSETCSNTCVTMAIPRAEGVITKFDGTADATLWPPTQDLRKVRISALNDRGTECDVTIEDVRQDESPGQTAAGAPIDDAVNCQNDGETSSVELRSKRASTGDGRAYHIALKLDDPDCLATARADEVVIDVPKDETANDDLKPVDGGSQLTASYSGPSLQCSPADDDRLARVIGRR